MKNYFEDLCTRLSVAQDERMLHTMKGKVGLSRTQNRLSEMNTQKFDAKKLKQYNEATMDVSWQSAAFEALEKENALLKERIQYQSQIIRNMLTLHKISELEKEVTLTDATLAAQDQNRI